MTVWFVGINHDTLKLFVALFAGTPISVTIGFSTSPWPLLALGVHDHAVSINAAYLLSNQAVAPAYWPEYSLSVGCVVTVNVPFETVRRFVCAVVRAELVFQNNYVEAVSARSTAGFR